VRDDAAPASAGDLGESEVHDLSFIIFGITSEK